MLFVQRPCSGCDRDRDLPTEVIERRLQAPGPEVRYGPFLRSRIGVHLHEARQQWISSERGVNDLKLHLICDRGDRPRPLLEAQGFQVTGLFELDGERFRFLLALFLGGSRQRVQECERHGFCLV